MFHKMKNKSLLLLPAVLGTLLVGTTLAFADEDIPQELRRWLEPQIWQRDVDGPILSLGKEGDFDDTHIFAPTVGIENGKFLLWYCGSTGFAWDVAPTRQPDERVFKVGLATSADGKQFEKRSGVPVMDWGDGKRSIITPTPLRNADGTLLREDGKLRMWLTSAVFSGDRKHTIHESSSDDGGLSWSKPSETQIQNGYCPTVIKDGDRYHMWFCNVGGSPWQIFHAESRDGHDWIVDDEPAIPLTQPWEHRLTIYPTVMKADGVYLMWYGSYTADDRSETAIGFAASTDGKKWHKLPTNPVLKSDPSRPWESHYCTSESVVRLPDGSFRIYYASRKAPPFKNLYFALNTAHWTGPPKEK
jgi:hypothetical protein